MSVQANIETDSGIMICVYYFFSVIETSCSKKIAGGTLKHDAIKQISSSVNLVLPESLFLTVIAVVPISFAKSSWFIEFSVNNPLTLFVLNLYPIFSPLYYVMIFRKLTKHFHCIPR
jgi:hypothetical protein